MHSQAYSAQNYTQAGQRTEVTLNTCAHSKIFKSSNCIENCQDCGSVVFSNGVKSYKTATMKFEAFIDTQKHYEAMIQKKLPLFKLKCDTTYYKTRGDLIKFINDTANYLNISTNTRHLAVFFLDFTYSQKPFSSSHFDLFAATSLMLAAKTMELDERIPFISRLRKYSGLNYRTEEFRKAEQTLIEALEWNLQHCTLVDILEFYMSQGVLYSNDILDNSPERKRGSLGTTLQESKTFNSNTTPQLISPNSRQFDSVTKEIRHSDSNSKQKGKENSSNIKTMIKDSFDSIVQAVSNLYVSDIGSHTNCHLEKKSSAHSYVVSHYEIERKPVLKQKASTNEKNIIEIVEDHQNLVTSDFKVVAEPVLLAAPERKMEVVAPHQAQEERKLDDYENCEEGENEGPMPPEADPEDEDGRPYWNAANERAEEIPEAPMPREEDDLEVGDEKEECNLIRNLEESEISEMLVKFQANAINLCNEIVLDATFIELDKKMLAAACVAYLRKTAGILNYWNPELALISGLSKYDFETYLSKLEGTFGSSFTSYMDKKAARAMERLTGYSGSKQQTYTSMPIQQNYYEVQPILVRTELPAPTYIPSYTKLQPATTSFLNHPAGAGSFYQHPFQKSFSLGGEFLGFSREEKAFL